jgi:hypothetical protein
VSALGVDPGEHAVEQRVVRPHRHHPACNVIRTEP